MLRIISTTADTDRRSSVVIENPKASGKSVCYYGHMGSITFTVKLPAHELETIDTRKLQQELRRLVRAGIFNIVVFSEATTTVEGVNTPTKNVSRRVLISSAEKINMGTIGVGFYIDTKINILAEAVRVYRMRNSSIKGGTADVGSY